MESSSPYTRTDISVGLFVLVGVFALGYLSISIGGLELGPSKRYTVVARFAAVGDLGEGAPVKMAGVTIGRVDSIRLKNYVAVARLRLDESVAVPEDTIASIRTSGLLGESYVSLSPGSAEKNLASGGQIMQTEPAIDLLELVEKYAFGSTGIEEDEGSSEIKDPLE